MKGRKYHHVDKVPGRKKINITLSIPLPNINPLHYRIQLFNSLILKQQMCHFNSLNAFKK